MLMRDLERRLTSAIDYPYPAKRPGPGNPSGARSKAKINSRIVRDQRTYPDATAVSAAALAFSKDPEANLPAVLLLQVSEPLFMR
jgi:hypothetical protein